MNGDKVENDLLTVNDDQTHGNKINGLVIELKTNYETCNKNKNNEENRNNNDFDDAEEDIDNVANRKRKKRKNKRQSTSENYKNENKEVPFLKLLKFSDKLDRFLIFIGTFAALFGGLIYPLMFFMYGELAGIFVEYDKFKFLNQTNVSSNLTHHSNQNTQSNSTSVNNGSIIANKCFRFNGINYDFDSRVFKSIKYYLVVGFLSLFVNYLANVCWNTACERQIKKMRNKLYEKIMRQDMIFFDKNAPGELNSIILSNIDTIKLGIGFRFSDFVNLICKSIACLVVAFVSAWKFTIAFLVLTPLIISSIVLMVMKMKKYTADELKAYESAGNIAQEMLSSIRTVLAFGIEKKAILKYTENLKEAEDLAKKKGLLSGIFISISTGLFNCFFAISIFYGTYLVRNDCVTYNVSKIIRALFCMISSCFSTSQALPYLRDFAEAKGAAKRVFAILDNEPASASHTGKRLDLLRGEITMDNVHFSYPLRDNNAVLKGVCLTIEPGKTVALVGASGSGKSTILSLIQRFYLPDSGLIKIDGHPIDELDIGWLRSQMALVSQEPVLFSGSIKDNIRLGRLDATDAEIEEAALMANAHNFIMSTGDQYDTSVGERGTHLSGGQKQRIAIARALIRNPKLLLLDEATSALDFESEKIVQDALDKAKIGRTTIIVAHRLTTIRNADTILCMSDGCIRECGTHDELMKQRGLYYDMVIAQTKSKKDSMLKFDTIESCATIDDESDVDEDSEHNLNINNPEMKIIHNRGGSTLHKRRMSSKIEPSRRLAKKKKSLFYYEKKLFRLQRNEFGWLIIGSVCQMIHGLVFPTVAILFSEIFKIFSLNDPHEQFQLSIKYMCIILAIAFVNIISTILFSYSFSLCGARLTKRLRIKMFESMLRQEVAFHDMEENKSGTLTSKLCTSAPLCKGLTSDKLSLMSQAFTSVGFATIVSFLLNWKLSLLVLIFVPVSFFTSVFVGRSNSNTKLKAKFYNEEGGRLTVETIENIRTVFSLGREAHFVQEFSAIFEKRFQQSLAILHLQAVFYSISNCLLFFIQALTFTFGYYLIRYDGLTVPNLFRVYTTLTFSSMILGRVYAQLPDQTNSLQATKTAFKIIERRSKIDPFSEKGIVPDKLGGSITFENVNFTYPNRPTVRVLRNLNLTIKNGQTNALVGSSGCGKSTIMALLLRFYDIDSGAIYLDNVDIRKLNLKWLRSKFGLVSQEPSLFNMSIFENICYGDVNRSNIDINEVVDVSIKSNIHFKIDSLANKYDTMVGNKGGLLSGGEKQRIAIARALVRKPNILLLDEATSALDNASEKIVQDALDRALAGRTCIVIAHRLSTIQNSNKISVIKDGALYEEGTHDELMDKGKFYCQLYSHSTLF